MERRLDYILRDARKLSDAARRHAKALEPFGIKAAEIDAQHALAGEVELLVARRDATAKGVADAVEERLAAFDAALDLAMYARRCARLAFDGPGRKDPAGAREFGVNGRPPAGFAALEREHGRIEEAFKNAKWKKAMEAAGAKSALAGELGRRVAAVAAAERKKGDLGTERRKAAAALEEKVKALREWTTHFRNGGNVAFHGAPEQVDFDPPPRPAVKHREKKPAATGAPGGGPGK